MKLFCYENPPKTCYVEENPYLCFWYVFPYAFWMGRCDWILVFTHNNDIFPSNKDETILFPFSFALWSIDGSSGFDGHHFMW